jgi:lipopolysaccharide export system ATP-binding protein
MTDGAMPSRLRLLISQLATRDRSTLLALHAIVNAADDHGSASFHDVAIRYREDTPAAMRAEGRDTDREAGVLGLDQVRANLADTVLPKLASEGIIAVSRDRTTEDGAPRITVVPDLWQEVHPYRDRILETLWQTGEHAAVAHRTPSGVRRVAPTGSTLAAEGLVKMYRRRRVVNDVALRLQQGEIVGLLGPNGAGKTTTFYMIVGLIQPLEGRIVLDGEDITRMPMYRRAQHGIGYLSQEPSIFRKLSVEDNILAILETIPGLSREDRRSRLESLLDELGIKYLRNSKAYALSGGERRRLEITRALVTSPKFMMLDEPFAGVDPIAVHDIQTIVADLRHRGIGVLISDHNVEQTLDIVDRAYIMFDGQVKVSGTVRELVFDDTVAEIYLGPTLTARLRSRFSSHEAPIS